MKKFIFAIIMAVAAFGMQAQDTEKTTKTVTGAVVDDNGNPMPGALVEATGGAESVTTDADGTFTLEVPVWLKSLTATYPGLKPRKVKLHNKFNYDEKVLFEMKKKKTGYWFLNAVYGHAETSIPEDYWGGYYENGFRAGDYTTGISYDMGGLMFGYLGKWGGYFKVMVPTISGLAVPDMSLGVTKSIYGGLYAYLGAGYSSVYFNNKYYSVSYEDWDRPDTAYINAVYDYGNEYQGAITFEGGLIYRYKRFNVNVGYAYGTLFSDYHISRFQASIGFCW